MDLSTQLKDRYGKSYLSYSSIKVALQDMQLFEMKMRNQLKFESPALAFGKLYDCLLLTPESFSDQFVVADDTVICLEIGGKAPQRTKAYSEWKESIAEEGKETVSHEDVTKAKEMIERLHDTGVHETSLNGDAQYEFNDFINDTQVLGIDDFRWVVQEKTYPYAVGLYFASEDTLNFGKMKFEKAVARIREHLDSGVKASSYYETDYI